MRCFYSRHFSILGTLLQIPSVAASPLATVLVVLSLICAFEGLLASVMCLSHFAAIKTKEHAQAWVKVGIFRIILVTSRWRLMTTRTMIACMRNEVGLQMVEFAYLACITIREPRVVSITARLSPLPFTYHLSTHGQVCYFLHFCAFHIIRMSTNRMRKDRPSACTYKGRCGPIIPRLSDTYTSFAPNRRDANSQAYSVGV